MLQTWDILQEALFCCNRTLCYSWAQTFQLVCADFPTNSKDHQAGIAYGI